MAIPLLQTKLHIPAVRPGLVSRPRLVELLDAGLTQSRQGLEQSSGFSRKLTLISAPAGFGKTTLMSEWVQHVRARKIRPIPCAWLTLDAGDNDPARFWAYFVAALQTIPGLKKAGLGDAALAELQSPVMARTDATLPGEPFLAELVNEIIAAGPALFILLLDDYHLIKTPSIHNALAFLLDHLPPQMHLVIATRADPPLPLARLRGRGHLSELRLTDLRFTTEEAAAFLNETMELQLTAENVTSLASRAEGWIAGLQLAALALKSSTSAEALSPLRQEERGSRDASAFIQAFTGTDRFVLDYLIEEVLQRQPESVQAFLLQTAILDRLTGPLCDAVCFQDTTPSGFPPPVGEGATSLSLGGVEGPGQATLEYLERANLFIVPLDNERRWFRYHRLFADLLRKRLLQVQPGLAPILHGRASTWYEQNGIMSKAIDHALLAGDFEWAAQLIEQEAETTLMRSEVTTLLQWIDALPGELVRTRPSLCVVHAWTLLLSGRPLDAVESRLEDIDGDSDLVLSKIVPLRAFLAVFQGQIPHAAELSRQALEHLPEDDLFLRSVAAWELGISYLVSGDIEAGSQTLDQALRMSQKAGNVMTAVMTLCNLAELHMAMGQLEKAKDLYQRALAAATTPQGQPLPISGLPMIGLGELLREQNDFEAAMDYVTRGIEQVSQWGEFGAIDGYVTLSRIRQAQGDATGANEALQKARQTAIRFDATEIDDFMVDLEQARLWIAQGHIETAMHWLEERGVIDDTDLAELEQSYAEYSSHIRRREQILLARVWIDQGHPDRALPLLETQTRRAKQRISSRRTIQLYLLKALAWEAKDNTDQAMNALVQALAIAEPGGYVRIFVDEGPPIARLLYKAAARGIAPEYTGRLLAAFPAPEPTQPSQEPMAQMVEPLSERELEILHLIAKGLTNQGIAQRLSLSLPTVKWHTSNIYGKLGVRSRTQAVARARTLGVLPAD